MNIENDYDLIEFYHRNTSMNDITIFKIQKQINTALSNKKFQDYCYTPDNIYEKYSSNAINLITCNLDQVKETNIFNCLLDRRTNSTLPPHNTKLKFETFSQLLRYSFGVSNIENNHSKNCCYKYTFPTEGGLNTIEIFVIVNSVETIQPGIYLFNPYVNTICPVIKKFSIEDYANITALTKQAANAFFTVYIVGNNKYSLTKYGARSYRFMNIEAGHCSQNLYLVSTAFGLECAASGAFYDDNFFNLLSIPSENRFLLYENFVGL